MFCTNCGAQIADNAAFCPQCGNPVVTTAAQQVAQPVAVAQQVQPAQQAQPMQPAQPMQQPGVPVASNQPQYTQVGAVPTNQPAARGCFGSGWDDVKNSEGWFKKVALMALIDLVPILNWVNIGYGWNWGKDLVMGKRESLPDKIVNGENFKLGFYVVVLAIIMAFALGFEGAILGIIPIIGILAAMALDIFAGMFVLLSNIRVALHDKLGAGFEVGKLFDAYKRNLGTLFCISIVPGLVAAGIGMVIFFVFLLVAGVFAGADLLAIMSSSARYGSYSYIPSSLVYGMGGSIAIVAVLFIVALYLELIAYQFCQLVTQRAAGHYIVRNVPEWAGEAAAARQGMATMGGYAPYGVQPTGGAPVPPQPMQQTMQPVSPVAAPAQQPMNATPVTPVAQTAQSGFAAPTATNPAPVSNVQEAAAPVAGAVAATAAAAGAVASSAAVANEPAPTPYKAPANYAFDETSVLPEMPEDMDTIVQPELKAQHAAPEPAQVEEAAPQPVAAKPQIAQVADSSDAVRLQPTVASGPLVGDDSDTMVLMEDAQAAAEPVAQSAAGQRTLQLTRANGDTCVLTSFPVTIGKGSEADLVIDGNGAISRVHARILRDGDVFAAEDLGSTNKTFIGTYELPANTPTILSDGDVLKLANEALQIKIV